MLTCRGDTLCSLTIWRDDVGCAQLHSAAISPEAHLCVMSIFTGLLLWTFTRTFTHVCV